jgi:hypothetical protein
MVRTTTNVLVVENKSTTNHVPIVDGRRLVMDWDNVVEINKENFGLLLHDYLDQRQELADLRKLVREYNNAKFREREALWEKVMQAVVKEE